MGQGGILGTVKAETELWIISEYNNFYFVYLDSLVTYKMLAIVLLLKYLEEDCGCCVVVLLRDR